MNKNGFKRQSEDYILTDTVPREIGNHFTLEYLYNYIINKQYNEIRRLYKLGTRVDFKKDWTSSPLKFKTAHNNSYRLIYLINPLAIIESLFFNHFFGEDILSIIHENNGFSIRVPYKNNELYYKKKKKGIIYYSQSLEDNKRQLLINLQSSGSFYKLKPFSSLSDFTNSLEYTRLRDVYSFFYKIDIENFFPSIYTHSFSWTITDKLLYRKNIDPSLFTNIDNFLKSINELETHGIVVGPEFSRLLSELLLSAIDKKVKKELLIEGLIYNTDYSIKRYIDDSYIFCDSDSVLNKIISLYQNELDTYRLKLNYNKEKKLYSSDIDNEWIILLKNYTNTLEDTFLNNIIKRRKIFSKKLYSSERNKINIILNDKNQLEYKVHYILSALVSCAEKITKRSLSNRKNKKKLSSIVVSLSLLSAYVCSLYVTYNGVQRLVRILSVLKKCFPNEIRIATEYIMDHFKKQFFDSYLHDWINLVLFIGDSGYIPPNSFIDELYISVKKSQDPIILAGFLIFLNKIKITKSTYIDSAKKLIQKNLKNVEYNNKYFFSDSLCWWVFIFLNSHYIETSLYKDIRNKLQKMIKENTDTINKIKKESILNSNAILSRSSKKLILQFLIEEKNNFIRWDFFNKGIYSKIYFFSKDRTLFHSEYKNTNLDY